MQLSLRSGGNPGAYSWQSRGNPVAISVHSNGTELVAGQIGASFEEAKEEGENKIGCIVSIMGVHTHQHYEHSSSAFSGAFSGTGAWAKRRIWGKGAVSIDIGRMNRGGRGECSRHVATAPAKPRSGCEPARAARAASGQLAAGS